MTDTIAVYLGIAVAVTVILGAVVYPVARRLQGAITRHRTKVVAEVVEPLLADHEDRINERLDTIQLNQQEVSAAVGRVYELERAIKNGLTSSVSNIAREQRRQGDRIDRIYDHLIED